jgi:subtilisin family serine protease
VELAAPGQDIVSTAAGGRYERRTGTSMATPHVAGALVLLAAARPDLGPVGWRDAILSTARPGLPVSAGSLNLSGALKGVLGVQYKSTLKPRAASLKRTACLLRRAKAVSAAAKRRARGRLFVNRAPACTSSAVGGKLGL